MATVVFTPQEQQMIANAINYGLFNQPGSWEQFQERLRNDWRREGAVERALNDSTHGVGRELRGIARAFSDPGIGVQAAREHFQKHGAIGGLRDNPLQTLTGFATFTPVGRLGKALAGAGARAAGINEENWKNINWANPKYEGISITPTFLPGTYVNTAQQITTGTRNPQIENKKAYAKQKFINFKKTYAQQKIRNLNVVSDSPLGQALGPQLLDANLGGQFGSQPQQSPQALPGGVVPFVHELWQTSDGSVVMPNTPGSKQTFENTRKYAYGDPNDESSVGAMTVKRVPNPETGTFDNRHWQVWFSGGAFGEVNADNSIFIDKSHGIDSYAGARDAVLSDGQSEVNIKTLWKNHQNNRQNREQRRQQRREERQQQSSEQNNIEQEDFMFNPLKPPYQQEIHA